jgi:peptidoglycan/LPS O-acetylase OafA/YrhL
MNMQSSSYLNSLTGLRGLAALIVTISHVKLYSSLESISVGSAGNFSVAIFFSLSGFLMGYIYAEKDFNNQTVRNYIISRTSRIAPAYLAIVLISFILFSFLDPSYPIQIDTSNLMRHLLFSGNQSILFYSPCSVALC